VTADGVSQDGSAILKRVATGAANGKLILLGEHAVVYGAPALAIGIDRGARAEAEARHREPSTLALGGRTIDTSVADDDLARAFTALLAEAPAIGPVAVRAESDLPPGGGLGSSAALGVAIARAAAALAVPRDDASPEDGDGRAVDVIARASAWERVFHGNPSGIDTAAAMHGGFFRFERARGMRPITPAFDVWLCVGQTGTVSSTRAMVEGVARLRSRKPELVDSAVAGVTSLVENGALAIEAGDLTALGRLMDLNQMILAGLMVSTETIEAMCSIARSAGALGAKLTGAGGGGSIVALIPSPRLGAPNDTESSATEATERVLAAWRSAGYDGFGVRVRAHEVKGHL
jgi:mevalonate kinase